MFLQIFYFWVRQVAYLPLIYILDDAKSGEWMALTAVNKKSLKTFLHKESKFSTSILWKLLCNCLTFLHFNYAFSTWNSNLTEKVTQDELHIVYNYTKWLTFRKTTLDLLIGYLLKTVSIDPKRELFSDILLIDVLVIWMRFSLNILLEKFKNKK